ncbi:DUF6188 family protein [Actinoplanes sp. CA-054009]
MSPLSPLVGQHLEYVRLGDALILSFSRGSQILIETAAHLTTPETQARLLPGDDSSDALASLLGDVVSTAQTADDGELSITFAAGYELRVTADPEVESWAFTNPDGPLIVCLPRGEIAIWAHIRASAS